MSAPQHSIINGSQLAGFVGKKISVFGLVNNASAGETSFMIRSTDNLLIPVELDKPLTEDINGYVEVKGTCLAGKKISADDFFTFNNQKFDAKSHNKLCKLLNSLPNVFSVKKH